jgi:hypothetical protein
MPTHVHANWPGKTREVLASLSKARACAVDLGVDPCDFAIPMLNFVSTGVDESDLRWLVARGYVRFRDRAQPLQSAMGGIACGNISFVITEKGAIAANLSAAKPSSGHFFSGKTFESWFDLPHWDAAVRRLWFGGELVKSFRLPAGNQVAVLAAFEDEGWPPSICDPLPFLPSRRAKERLHATIRCLNSHHVNRALRFRGDGTGESVLWEPLLKTADGTTLGLRHRA